MAVALEISGTNVGAISIGTVNTSKLFCDSENMRAKCVELDHKTFSCKRTVNNFKTLKETENSV